MSDIVKGRVWKFGDNINTDLMLPGDVHAGDRGGAGARRVRRQPPGLGGRDEARRHHHRRERIMALGRAAPPRARCKNIGIACLVADSLNGLFFRNCVNFGLLALECAGVSELFPEEGQIAQVSLTDFRVTNLATRKSLTALPVPPNLLKLMRGGGIYPVLEREGLIAPKAKIAKVATGH